MRDFVENRRWISEQEFFSGLALAQAFPGVNVVNLSIWIGFRLRGGPGALVAALGMIVGPMLMAIAVVSLFDQLARFHVVAALIAGAATVAIGMSLSMGLRAARSLAMQVIPMLVIVAIILALAVLRWPLLPVLLGIVPISVGLSFWRLHAEKRRS
jgi:chromate transporter